MALQFQEITVQLEGLDQKTDPRFTKPGKLLTADNVEISETGTLRRRRGYKLVYVLRDVEDVAIRTANQFHHVATFQDELLVFGHDELFSVVSKDNGVTVTGSTAGLARKGRTYRGNFRTQNVATGDAQNEDGTGG